MRLRDAVLSVRIKVIFKASGKCKEIEPAFAVRQAQVNHPKTRRKRTSAIVEI